LNIRNNANALGRGFVRVENPDAADHSAQPPGKANGDTLPSAPAVVLPTTVDPCAARRAMAVYSA
jgi:hypothetical protein